MRGWSTTASAKAATRAPASACRFRRRWFSIAARRASTPSRRACRPRSRSARATRRRRSTPGSSSSSRCRTPISFPNTTQMRFYTWGDADCCLPRGATEATLIGSYPNLQLGDMLIFKEALGPADRLSRRRRHPPSLRRAADRGRNRRRPGRPARRSAVRERQRARRSARLRSCRRRSPRSNGPTTTRCRSRSASRRPSSTRPAKSDRSPTSAWLSAMSFSPTRGCRCRRSPCRRFPRRRSSVRPRAHERCNPQRPRSVPAVLPAATAGGAAHAGRSAAPGRSAGHAGAGRARVERLCEPRGFERLRLPDGESSGAEDLAAILRRDRNAERGAVRPGGRLRSAAGGPAGTRRARDARTLRRTCR